MQIDLEQHRFTDPMMYQMKQAYDASFSDDKPPCQLCAEHPEQEGRRVHFHASDFGACPRKVYFKMTTGITEKFFGTKAAFLKNGHLQEAFILEQLKRTLPVTIAKNLAEIKILVPMVSELDKIQTYMENGIADVSFDGTRKFYIIGHWDGMLKYGELDKEEAILECKSVKDNTFNKCKTGEISDEWYGQIQAYMFLLRLSRAYLLVHNRTTSELLQPIRIDYDEEYCTKRIRILINIYKSVNIQREVPKSDSYKGTCSECRFCTFRNRCYGEDEPMYESKPTRAEVKDSLIDSMFEGE